MQHFFTLNMGQSRGIAKSSAVCKLFVKLARRLMVSSFFVAPFCLTCCARLEHTNSSRFGHFRKSVQGRPMPRAQRPFAGSYAPFLSQLVVTCDASLLEKVVIREGVH